MTKQDISRLLRILGRVEADPRRAPEEKARLTVHLKAAVSILLGSEATRPEGREGVRG